MPNGEYIMIIELLDRTELSISNKKLNYPLAIAEKDYFLAVVSKIIYNSPLKEKLVFKGGTALHHTYLPQLRFSEDLDFTSLDPDISLDEVKKVFAPYEFLTIKKEFVSKATIKIERLLYNSALGQPNSLKVEIDFFQNVVLPAKEMGYTNNYGVKTKVKVMDILEITAEKIRAMSDRVRYRDFYDFAIINKNSKINIRKTLDLVSQKEIRNNISKKSILENWELAKQEKENEYSQIYYSLKIEDNEVENTLSLLDFTEIKK